MMTIRTARRVAAALITSAALSACAGPEWVPPPGMDAQQARVKFYECQRDGQQMIAVSAVNMMMALQQSRDCLAAHGFTTR
jgi:hypothetical protein